MTQDCNSAAGAAVPPAQCRASAPEAQMKLMKQLQMVIPKRPGFGDVIVSRRAAPRLLAIGGIAGCAIMLCFLSAAPSADALPTNAPADQAAAAKKQAYSPKAYQMQRYKAFARQAELPV